MERASCDTSVHQRPCGDQVSVRYVCSDACAPTGLCAHSHSLLRRSAVGLVCALWDHIITLDDEVNLIWRKKMDVSKLAFFFYRYGTEAGLLYVNYSEYSAFYHLNIVADSL